MDSGNREAAAKMSVYLQLGKFFKINRNKKLNWGTVNFKNMKNKFNCAFLGFLLVVGVAIGSQSTAASMSKPGEELSSTRAPGMTVVWNPVNRNFEMTYESQNGAWYRLKTMFRLYYFI